jgi:hypothetical protein
LFKTKGVGQRFMAVVFNAPVSVMESAGEGGAWGITLLVAFVRKYGRTGEMLEKFLTEKNCRKDGC